MGEHTRIEWCDHTFNPWIGCTKLSPGCDGCYAERSAPVRVLRSRSREPWGPDGARYLTNVWGDPRRWNKRHDAFVAQHGRRQRVFCASLADVFDNQVPEAWRFELLNLIADTPNLDWLLLTKRIGNAKAMLDAFMQSDGHRGEAWDGWPNVWIGATVVNQAEADRDIPKLLAVPARVRFLSIEPMLGPVDLRFHIFSEPTGNLRTHDGKRQMELRRPVDGGLHWVICGGESGPKARPMHPDWARSLRDQCAAAGVPFLFKQWGEWCPRGPESLGCPSVDGVPRLRVTHAGQDGQNLASRGGNQVWMNRAGKRTAGRLLDGREHNGFPA